MHHALCLANEDFPSSVMKAILTAIRELAPSMLNLVVVGERGTGKSWAAMMVHRLSTIAKSTFVHLECESLVHTDIEERIFGYESFNNDCTEIRPGAMEEANGGTLIVDEINSLPIPIQRKVIIGLVRQHIRRVGGKNEMPIRARVLATATGPDRGEDVRAFRKELFHGLNPVIINMPPLRERREDIPLIIKAYLEDRRRWRGMKIKRISREALRLCVGYDWPSNLRQLFHAIDHGMLSSPSGVIEAEHLPLYIHGTQKSLIIGERLRHFYEQLQGESSNAADEAGQAVAGFDSMNTIQEGKAGHSFLSTE